MPATANEPSQSRGEGRAQQSEPNTEQPQADHQHDDRLTAEARDLISYFHQRFHGAPHNDPHPNALNQATKLMVKHGIAKARHIVDFAYNKAKETNYEPATLAGILHYTPQALADYDQAQQRKDAAATAREAQRKAEEEQQLRRQYEDYCAARLAEVRATTPPAVIAAIEAATAAQFDQENTSRFGRDRLRQIALDAAVAAHFQLPSLTEWQAAQEQS